MELKFEWDRNKAKSNFRKHNITFDEARTIFSDDFVITFPDGLHSDEEHRFISIGFSTKSRILLVVHTEEARFKNEIVIRIISTRKATASEEKAMKKENKEMLAEYDFSGKKGVRGKYAKAYKKGHSVRIYGGDKLVSDEYFGAIDSDIREYFPDSKAVNGALRKLISLVSKRSRTS